MVTLPQGAGKLGLRGEFRQLGRSARGGAERGTGRGSSCDVMVVPRVAVTALAHWSCPTGASKPLAITRLNR
jgi:hypothetical protein